MDEFLAEYGGAEGDGEVPELEPIEVPRTIVTEGGQELIQIGDVEHAKQIYKEQGNNDYKFQGTCGLASIAGTSRMLGLAYSENDIVLLASSFHPRLVDFALGADGSLDLANSGGTCETQQLELFRKIGIDAHEEDFNGSNPADMESIASAIENGQGVVANVNAGVLWREEIGGDAGEQAYRNNFGTGLRNHAIEVVGVGRDPQSGEIKGFYINDTGDINLTTGKGEGAGRFISVETMRVALAGFDGLPAHGSMIVTDVGRGPVVG